MTVAVSAGGAFKGCACVDEGTTERQLLGFFLEVYLTIIDRLTMFSAVKFE